MKTLAMLHTGPVVIQPLKNLVKSIIPEVNMVNLMDDSIVAEIEQRGEVTNTVRSRLNYLGLCAVDAGADAILITCSSISELAEPLAQHVSLPVFKIDEAMAERAVQFGRLIGVVATLPTTLEPTVSLIESKARASALEVTVDRALCREAFDRLSQGDEQGHDNLVLDAVRRLAKDYDYDVIVLAQASMARLKNRLNGLGIPVLTSPELGIKRVRTELERLGLIEGGPDNRYGHALYVQERLPPESSEY